MSEEIKAQDKRVMTVDDYEKAKKNFNNEEYSQEEFLTLANLYADSFKDVKEGEMVKAKIVRIQGDQIILDVGFKSEGSVSKQEFYEGEEIKIGNVMIGGGKINKWLTTIENEFRKLKLMNKKLSIHPSLWYEDYTVLSACARYRASFSQH